MQINPGVAGDPDFGHATARTNARTLSSAGLPFTAATSQEASMSSLLVTICATSQTPRQSWLILRAAPTSASSGCYTRSETPKGGPRLTPRRRGLSLWWAMSLLMNCDEESIGSLAASVISLAGGQVSSQQGREQGSHLMPCFGGAHSRTIQINGLALHRRAPRRKGEPPVSFPPRFPIW